ncbi:tetratricopeptide repeat protein [Cardiobacteriaceae bacterium TAE3-ERU3]|nr:tetratricopeptide repeat protein [Cardiobacteriaceae bacterium TAE3-ERU3]
MAEWLVIFLLPFAAWSGWWVAMRREARLLRHDRSRAAYFDGLSYLLNDQTDKAVEIFVAIAEFDHQTIENQLTLGRLFRRRGEVDRALHLHKQLEQQADPGSLQKYDILFELGEDYRYAGMFAQAQDIFESLMDTRPQQRVMEVLLGLYERTGNWQQARELAERWQSSGYGDQSAALANYDCEQAVEARAKGNAEAALRLLKAALQRDAGCVRSNVLLGKYFLEDGQYVQALHALQSIAQQSEVHLPDALPMMTKAYQALDREEEYREWLCELGNNSNKARLIIAIADALKSIERTDAAVAVLSKALERTDSPLLIWACLQFGVDIAVRGKEIMAAIKPQTVYQCQVCGFRQQHQCWHCPACFEWSSFTAALELKVEQR